MRGKGKFWGAMYVFLFRKKKKGRRTKKKKRNFWQLRVKRDRHHHRLYESTRSSGLLNHTEREFFFFSLKKESLANKREREKASNVMNSRSTAAFVRLFFFDSNFLCVFPATVSHIACGSRNSAVNHQLCRLLNRIFTSLFFF